MLSQVISIYSRSRQRETYALYTIFLSSLYLLLLIPTSLYAQNRCAVPGKDGPGGTLSGVINTYYPGTGDVSSGNTSVPVGTPTGAATTISAGDLLLVIQMQDATIDSDNNGGYGDGANGNPARGSLSIDGSGLYEYVMATGAVSGGSVPIRGAGTGNGLVNSYNNENATSSRGQRRFQVVRVPQYSTATLGSTLTASAWNGRTGGILAFDVAGTLNLGSASVSVSGLGFRGGGARQLSGGSGGSNTDYRRPATSAYHGSKGEGIAGTPRYVFDPTFNTVSDTTVDGYPNGSMARGAPGNAGGGGTDGNPAANDQNSGGGGGANGGNGGNGGNSWNSNLAVGGFGGGAPLSSASATRLMMGGGGGAGSRNNSSFDMSSGGAGGGIVMIRVGSATGSATISANGSAGSTPDNDGGGGGGAGGTVLFASSGSMGSITINARGGNGGNAWPSQSAGSYPGERHGPGGGGGGGVVITSGSASINVSGGTNGTTTTAADAYGATGGSTGLTATISITSIPGIYSGGQCIPALTTTKSTSTSTVTNTPTGTTAIYTITVTNSSTRGEAREVSISDALPTNFTYASTNTITLTGGATRPTTINPTAGATNPMFGSFNIPGGGSVQLTFTVSIASSVSGTQQNPATATYLDPVRTVSTGTTSVSYDAASSTAEDVTVLGLPNLVLNKSVSPTGTQPPGTELTYTIDFTNNGGSPARNIVLTDPIPSNTDLKVGSPTATLGTTGLTVTISYSNNNGSTFTYVPTSGAGGAPAGYDRTVTHVRWTFTGNLSQTSPNNSGNVIFTVQIR
jgi:uncharacterized repeat protein (TIGR01451 family)/fimbrial isopeptide formation D2 family protein